MYSVMSVYLSLYVIDFYSTQVGVWTVVSNPSVCVSLCQSVCVCECVCLFASISFELLEQFS